VPVEVLPGPVISHGRSWIGVAGSDLHVAQADAGVEHGGDECVAKHVRVHPCDPYAHLVGQGLQPPGSGMPVHPNTVCVAQDRPVVAAMHGAVDRAGHRRWQRDQDGLVALARGS
jgi:hypothetical protein